MVGHSLKKRHLALFDVTYEYSKRREVRVSLKRLFNEFFRQFFY